MSGPWDRPSSPNPDDRDWPAEDLEATPSSSRADPWSAEDPWQQPASDSSSSWDVWPSPAPPPDDLYVEEPPMPSSDPWAETWTDDDVPGEPHYAEPDAGAVAPRQEEPARYEERPRWEPESPRADEPATEATAPAWEPPTEPARRDEPPAPRPWQPEPDPWGPTSEAWEPARPWQQEGEAARQPEPEPEPASTDFAPPAGEEQGAEPADARRPLWPPPFLDRPESEPTAEDAEAAEPESGAPEVEPEREPEAEQAAQAAPAPEIRRPLWPPPFLDRPEPEPTAEEADAAEPESGAPEAEPEPEPEAAAEAAPAPEIRRPLWPPPFLDRPEREPDEAEAAEREPDEAAPEPEHEPELGAAEAETPLGGPSADETAEEDAAAPIAPVWEPDLWLDGPGEGAGVTTSDEPERPMTEAEAPAATIAEQEPIAGVSEEEQPSAGDEVAELDAESGEAEAAAMTSGAELSGEDAFPEEDAEYQDEIEATAEAGAGDEPEPVAAASDDDPWDRGESTQVFPTSWTPPPPERRALEPEAGVVRTSLAQPDAFEDDEYAARPSTAEQAVPWLIGVILLLAGMVIVLLALIFAGDGSLGGRAAASTESDQLGAVPSGSAIPVAVPSTPPAPTPTPAPSVTPAPTPTPIPAPQYGALELIYQGRSAALAPIYLLNHDFTTDEPPAILAQDDALDVRRFAWAPDGTVGACLLADILVSIEPGAEKRRLGEGISTITFGDDASTLYAVRVTAEGANDVAAVLAIDFLTGDTTEVTSVTYARPDIGDEDALAEAQFADEGGTVRLYWTEDDTLVLWSLGAGSWEIAPEDGALTDLGGAQPTLWSPDGSKRIELTASGATTTLALHEGARQSPTATTTIDGRVSHVRWSPAGARITFTVGRLGAGGGIIQNLFLWDLADGQAPMQLTATGAAFGAEWRGSQATWRVE